MPVLAAHRDRNLLTPGSVALLLRFIQEKPHTDKFDYMDKKRDPLIFKYIFDMTIQDKYMQLVKLPWMVGI